MQAVTECLLALEANPHPEVINRLFRAMHTVKGSAAQVGLQRIATVAHRAEDLVGRLRDGVLRPSPAIVDVCLESVDTLKKFLYRQWTDEASMNAAVKSLLGRIAQLAPAEEEEADTPPPAAEATPVALFAEEPLQLEPDAEPVAASAVEPEPTALAPEVLENEIAAPKAPAGTPQSKSVRIALDRLDRMMNAVGELVINRTRMLGRLSELEQLADVLNFSKARMQDKVSEFQEKYEFSRITGVNPMDSLRGNGYARESFGFGGFGGNGGNGGRPLPGPETGPGGYRGDHRREEGRRVRAGHRLRPWRYIRGSTQGRYDEGRADRRGVCP